MTTLIVDAMATPAGPFAFAATEEGALVASAFGGLDVLRGRLRQPNANWRQAPLPGVREQLSEFVAGRRADFTLPLAPQGSPFQEKVWAALQTIPPGETRSYGQLAKTLASSARAVGGANARNPLCLFVPCHRVIGADGQLTGFAFGEVIKAWLLNHERRYWGQLAGVALSRSDPVENR